MRLGRWDAHPHVRSGPELSFGERAADKLKAAFGSWMFLIILNVIIGAWIVLNVVLPQSGRWDVYPFILLNLGLSCLAAQQGGALQIAANRGDRISAEVALHTFENGQLLLELQQRQMQMLAELRSIAEPLTGAERESPGAVAAPEPNH